MTRTLASSSPAVAQILIAPGKAMPMVAVDVVRAIKDVGLEGDRYAVERGTFSGKRHSSRHVTLISSDDIAHANASLVVPFTPAEARRNIVISGRIRLLELIGKEFDVGEVRMRGFEECPPCAHPARLANKPGFVAAFGGLAGIRAVVVEGGAIRVGDVLRE